MVVKRAFPFWSRLTPDAEPMGRSGPFTSAGASVVSAQFFSEGEGLRSAKMSWIGLSARLTLMFVLSGAISLRVSDSEFTLYSLFSPVSLDTQTAWSLWTQWDRRPAK